MPMLIGLSVTARRLNLHLLLRQGWRSYVIIRSAILTVSRITHDRGNGRRPNMVGMDKG